MDEHSPSNDRITINVMGENAGFCKTGVPFPIGRVTSLKQLKLQDGGINIACYARPLSHWSDGSIKWITLGFYRPITNSNQYNLTISDESSLSENAQCNEPIQLHSDKKTLTISTDRFEFIFNLEALSLSVESGDKQKQLFQIKSLAGVLSHSDNQQRTAKLIQWDSRQFRDLSTNSVDVIELTFKGIFEYETEKQPLEFVTMVEIYCSSPFIKVKSTLHNPNPAKHLGGVWDLGDEGSELFNDFIFELNLNEKENVKYKISPNSAWQSVESNFKISQLSSGGDNWDSPTHANRDNHVPLNFNGFEIEENQLKINHAGRATPTLHSEGGITLTIDKFWQNFPTSIEAKSENIRVGLFPQCNEDSHELQGGEQKTHTFWVNLSGELDSLDWVHTPPIAKPDMNWLIRCAALPTLSALDNTNPIAELIKCGLEHEQNFFAKREAVDEYGWRNFGDLYADHERANHEGDELFISHYNNQYDPIFGFIKQFLLTADPRWFELADDLAKHVTDIDIYHTVSDKAEYNGGLFWHTDHYLKAYTSTHRSYSKLQENNAYEGRSGGGGPGGQHCYTTGLTSHYLLTGVESSKLAVLTLAKWITCVYEGTGTCLELLLAIKNRNTPGLKNHLSGQYPFDRGTAHYVIALLDCYQLTQEQTYLDQVEHIIQNTVNPNDDITERDLTNAEECWFYTVFLQAVCRYLEVKELATWLDDKFYYARDVLLNYADWMLENEQPYLEKPEILEFPNDTWTAQDLRKTHILAAASYYSPDNNERYLDKSHYFYQYVAKHLAASAELSYTRILVLLMQNYGALEYYESKQKVVSFSVRHQNWPKSNYQQASGLMVALPKAFGKRLLKLSIANEINWLRKRIGK